MRELNLPEAQFRFQMDADGRQLIFDEIRKKWIVLTPEEWVRQNFISYLSNFKSFPKGLMMVEKEIKLHGLKRRPDLVIFSRKGEANMIIEFKAPNEKIDEEVFFQAAMYNKKLQVPYLILSNGLIHFCARIDKTTGRLTYLKEIPNYDEAEFA